MDPLLVFENFKLDTLDEKWSDEVWNREFVSFPDPPVEYSIILGSEDMEQSLRETCSTLKKWMAQNKDLDESNSMERPEVSWQTITAMNINVRGLLAVLGYLIKTGQAAGADEDSRQACLASASLYFILLSIPGSSTFHVFHPNLYQRAIDTLKLSELLVAIKKNQRVNDLESLYAEPPDNMLQSERNTLTKGLNSILYDLITMLQTFYMKFQLRSLEVTVVNLVEVTKLETEVNHFLPNRSKRTDASTSTLSYNAYVALQNLCDLRHGVVETTIKLIMKYLMPHLCPHHLDLSQKAANVVWDTIIHFFQNLLNSSGTSAEMGMGILIQSLLLNNPDRSEPRQKQAAIISKLINICKGKLFLKSIENLIYFSFNNKISSRIFAQEVITKLLTEISFGHSEDEIKNREKARMVLIATVHSRSIDTSNMVRGKAMSTVESIVNSEQFAVDKFLNMSEEDHPFLMAEALVAALSGDSNPLPGPNTFNSMLLERIKDERALVRRSTMHVLQHLVTHFPALLDAVTPIIGQHCRDPALSVRRDAIHALASLLQDNPLHPGLLNEYIKSVLPRIHDVETKVQEKVLESLQNLVLDIIRPFSSEKDDEAQELPWRIMHKLTREKMRKNLSKICDSWVKNGVVTNTVISRIQSHIGTVHDEESWVLLLAVAENMQLPNMRKYLENLKEIIQGDDFVSVMKMEVLRYTWQGMDKEYLENLSRHCFECLCKFRVSIESIGTCVDILDGITKHLHQSADGDLMLSQLVNLMRLSEAQINKLEDEDEEVDDDNICLYLKAMSTLGHVSLLCSEDVNELTLSLVQGLLLDCDDTNKMSEDQLDKFKAAGVVLLGQQALRDRELAEKVMPILGRLMCTSSSSESLAQAAIRINAVKALADLCIRFTALVEPYLPDMCVTMKDHNAQVRETIVVIFVQLLLEDFIKVKGAFFYHILTMLSDSDETIRELTIFLIKERLLVKNKTLISQSFVKSLFHYNNCQLKHKFNDRKIRKKEKEALTLPGKRNERKRKMIYDFMIEHLDPPSKLKILTKLNSEIFEGVCEKLVDVKQPEGACVLKDVFYIALNDRMHASFGTKVQDDDVQEDASTAIEAQTSNALNVIVEGMKKFKFNVMAQTLIRLRQFLSACKSPLLTDASRFFSKLLSEFNKDQVAEILDEYPDLKKDIDRDISMCKDDTEEDSESDSNEECETVDNSGTEKQQADIINEKDLNANVPEENAPREKSKQLKSTPRKIQDIQLGTTAMPRIILRRLSSLTYPGIKEWRSPTRESKIYLNFDPEPSSSGISVSSRSTSEDLNTSSVDDLSETELSSTPKPNKIARLSASVAGVQSS